MPKMGIKWIKTGNSVENNMDHNILSHYAMSNLYWRFAIVYYIFITIRLGIYYYYHFKYKVQPRVSI